VTVRVTDNGSPAMSSTASFTITVALPPRITSARIVNGEIQLTAGAIVGKTYVIEYIDDLNNLSHVGPGNPWTRLSATQMTATGGTITFNLPLSASGQRFYRLVQVD
jgi:hypothetical protein